MNKQLQDMIEEFLSEKRISNGGWAEPTINDMSQLRDIVYELLISKFELDPDGDLPVDYILVDRTREELPPYIPTMYTHKVKNEKDWIYILSNLNLNKRMAEDRFQTAITIFLERMKENILV